MSEMSWLLADPGFVASGWTLLIILWQTTIVAVLLAMWRGIFRGAPARVHHAATVVAFVLVVALAVSMPALLRAMPADGLPTVGPSPDTAIAAFELPTGTAVTPHRSLVRPHGSTDWDSVAAAVTAGWILGVLILTARLCLALVAVAAVRRRAVRITSGALDRLVQQVRAEQGVTRSIEVLASSEINAPAVVGWRKPALIVPARRMSLLPNDVVAGLFAHELAHVRRRDYLVNVLQSIFETLLWFSPAVAWIGRCVRETREFCCDDEAIRSGADPLAYIRALAMLASGDALARSQAAMSATGPRLSQRARRLLAIEPPPRRVPVGATLGVVALVALGVSGADVLRASSERVSRLGTIQTPLGVSRYPPVPYGYPSEQFDGAIEISAFVSTFEHPARRVRVRNAAGQRIVGLRFVAAVEQMPSRRRLLLVSSPVRLFVSEVQAVSIAPGAGVDVSPEVLTGRALQAIVTDAAGAHVQFHLAVAAVRYEDGQELRLTLNPLAARARDALSSEPGTLTKALGQFKTLTNFWQGSAASLLHRQDRPTIPRALIGSAPSASGVCRDERGRAYSTGAHVPVRDEPAHSVRCDSGRWIETSSR